MSRFKFARSTKSRRLCERIVEALVTICGKSEAEAISLIEKFWVDVTDIEQDPLLYHEPAYYYAMTIAHHPLFGDNTPEWQRDSKLWPPPGGWKKD